MISSTVTLPSWSFRFFFKLLNQEIGKGEIFLQGQFDGELNIWLHSQLLEEISNIAFINETVVVGVHDVECSLDEVNGLSLIKFLILVPVHLSIEVVHRSR